MQENLDLQTIEKIRETYPAYQRYWCCGRTVTSKHSKNCPSVPTSDGPEDNESDVFVS